MKVLVCDLINNEIMKFNEPFVLPNPQVPVICCFDQSSTCTALTVGDRNGQMYLNVTFERNTGSKEFESVEVFLEEVERWLRVILSDLYIIDWAIEKFVSTKWNRSDAVTKQVRGKILSLFHKFNCKDENGTSKALSRTAQVTEVNNKEWKSVAVPIEYFRKYKDDKVAVQTFFSTLFPVVYTMPQDISDSMGIYTFLVKTKHGDIKLRPTKSSLNFSHSLVMMAFPFNDINNIHDDIIALTDGDMKFDTGQINEYKRKYRKSALSRILHLLHGEFYSDEVIENSLSEIDNNLGLYLADKTETDINEITQEAKHFSGYTNLDNYREIDFNDKMSAEENMRCFTWKDKKIYYAIIDKGQHFCYLIPMFGLKVGHSQKILLVATKY